ncbi:hypothetical protein U1Q18_024774 [Sarracenia purpurea var. burkii]
MLGRWQRLLEVLLHSVGGMVLLYFALGPVARPMIGQVSVRGQSLLLISLAAAGLVADQGVCVCVCFLCSFQVCCRFRLDLESGQPLLLISLVLVFCLISSSLTGHWINCFPFAHSQILPPPRLLHDPQGCWYITWLLLHYNPYEGRCCSTSLLLYNQRRCCCTTHTNMAELINRLANSAAKWLGPFGCGCTFPA